jgi:hypothetical protein
MHGVLEQSEPALEMRRFQPETDVRGMRIAGIAAAFQRDRGPEIHHLAEMDIPPACQARLEDRPEHRVLTDASVEGVDDLLDEWLG